MINLGISFSGEHDTSCSLVIDKKLVFAISEERLTRVKQDGSFPVNSINACLQYADLNPHQVDNVTIAWSEPKKQLYFDTQFSLKNKFGIKSLIRTLNSRLRHCFIKGGFKKYERNFGKSNFYFCDHHLSHAISAYAYSGFTESTVVVIDGRGAFEASSIWHGRDGQLEPVEIIKYPNSLGLFYAKFTEYLGFIPFSDEWKVMGLAPYGKSGIKLDRFIENNNSYKVHWEKLFGKGLRDVTDIEAVLGDKRNNSNGTISQKYKNIAYAVQNAVENAMLSYVKRAVNITGCKNICLAGGVALNCKANGLIANSELVDNIFIQPASSDEGASLGAAMYPYMMLSDKKLPVLEIKDSYLGNSYGEKEIEESIINYKLSYEKPESPSVKIAELLEEGKIVGLFHGRMEFGPRALGNRSIIADPRNSEMKDRVNESVKYRETWRPFAPSILEENYFEFFDTKFLSPFMVLSFPVKDDARDKIPAAVHVDGTARPQSVNKTSNPFYWEIINEFYKLTGVPAVLNTSFNLKGEPIVGSPFDAIRTFYTSGLDVLYMEPFLILK